MYTVPPPDTKPFSLLRLLAVIAVVAALAAFAPWQAAPATPPMPPPSAFLLPPPDAQVWRAFHRQHSASSKPMMSEQTRHHLIPPLGVKP